MDKEFEKKIKSKRIRIIAVVIVLAVCVAWTLKDTSVEKSDYTQSLLDQIETAETLFDQAKENKGNESGQYAPYTLLAFEHQIKEAKTIAEADGSTYNEKKDAYLLLEDQVSGFKKETNSDVIDKSEMDEIAKGKETKTYVVDLEKDKELSYAIKPNSVKTSKTLNLMAKEEGPYHEQLNEILGKLNLQGQTISFYHDGDFGVKANVTVPMYSEKATKGYAYKVELKTGKLSYVSKATIDVKAQSATFDVSEGGDYVVLTKKIHKASDKGKVDIEEAEKEAEEKSQSSDGKQPADSKEEEKEIAVTIEIRCDTLAADLSKLEDPALESYVPADGTILATTEVKVKPGATVFDVLNKVCRDRNIQVECIYTPMYGSYYVESINYLYEFDGGKDSGWMYKVNGKFYNYGASSCTLKDGDKIVWVYTCDLGADVGNSF